MFNYLVGLISGIVFASFLNVQQLESIRNSATNVGQYVVEQVSPKPADK